MTNQNVVVPIPNVMRSSIGMAIEVAVSNSTLFSPAVPETLEALGGFLGLYKNTLVRRLESGGGKGGAKDSALIDSMRASSPPKLRSNFPIHETQEKKSWMLNHPSAIDKFEDIACQSKGKQIVMFLDYDGTLSAIVSDPDRAFMTKKMRAALKDVAKHFPTAIVSGRSINKLYDFVRLAELYYAGSHGMDIKGPTKRTNYNKSDQAVLFQPASKFLPLINEVYKILLEKTKSVEGAKVENNKFCLSVHFRCVDEKSWDALAGQVRSVVNEYPKLKLTQGRKVLEIRPIIKWDKGRALEFLLESLGYANSRDVYPIYIGDDRTDEDAFKVLQERGEGAGILVSKVPKETKASYTLQDPSEVQQFLRLLVAEKIQAL